MDEFDPKVTTPSPNPESPQNTASLPIDATPSFSETAGTQESSTPPVTPTKPVKSHKWKFWAPAIVVASALIVFAALALPHWLNGTHTTAATTQSSVSSTAPSATSNPSDTSNQALTNDYNSLQSTSNQENSDQTGANSSLNDSSQQITVPTN